MALRLLKQNYQDIERIIEFDFVRATEAAALNSLRWLGRGDKEAADAAACDAMRGMFDLMNIRPSLHGHGGHEHGEHVAGMEK